MRREQFVQLLLPIACLCLCLLLIQNTKPQIMITVQSDVPINKLGRIIQLQRERIQYLSSHPKVIYRCPDDEPAITYPRFASDDLTDIVMATNDDCGNASTIDALILVHTAAKHFFHRRQFREMYGNYSHTSPYRLKVVFLIGSSLDADLHIRLEQENMEFGDTVVGDFLDTYQNLTLKAVMGFRWLVTSCPDVKLLIKMDDDVLFDARKFFSRYWRRVGNDRKKKSIHCLVWHNSRVKRSGKWRVGRGLYASETYHFPYCAGFFVVISPDLIRPMYEHAKRVNFFWIDDVFLYGMVPAAIKGVHFIQLGGNKRYLTESYSELLSCRQKSGSNACSIWAALTNDKSEFDFEFINLSPMQKPSFTNKTIHLPSRN